MSPAESDPAPPDSAKSAAPVIVNTADGVSVPLLVSLVRYRGYIRSNALQEFLYKYTGTTVGLLWNFIHPVMMVVVFSIVFTHIMPGRFVGFEGLPFIVVLCSGLLPWMSFVDAVQRSTTSLVDNAGYLRKLAIPEEVFIAKAVVGSAILLAINLAVVLAAALLAGVTPSLSWLLAPLTGGLMLLLAFGLGTALGTLHVFVRDIGQVVPIVTQAWMWLTPIVYASQTMPEALRAAQFANPIFPFIELLREQVLLGSAGAPLYWLLAFGWSSFALIVGALVLRRMRAELRDVL
jgi:ABC-type polysaccharide/polyol phosphate export permease